MEDPEKGLRSRVVRVRFSVAPFVRKRRGLSHRFHSWGTQQHKSQDAALQGRRQ